MRRIKNISIRMKLLIGLGLIVVILSVVLFGFGYYYLRSVEETRLEMSNAEKKNLIEVLIDNNKNLLSSDLEIIASNDAIRKSYIEQNREALYKEADAFFEKLRDENGIAHLDFIGKDGVIFLRVNEKDKHGDISTSDIFAEAVNTGEKTTGIELDDTGFALRTVIPYRSGNAIIGYIEIGMDMNQIISIIKSKTGSEFEALGKKQYINKSDWITSQKTLGFNESWDSFDIYATLSETKNNSEIDGCLTKTMNFEVNEDFDYKMINSNGKDLVCNSFALKSIHNSVIGELVYTNDMTDVISNMELALEIRATLIFSLALSLWWFAYLYVSRLLLKPLSVLNKVVDEITSSGNLSMDAPASSGDEFGSLGASFNHLKDKLQKSQEDMEQKVKKRTAELEHLNSLMVGRELRMIELKNQLPKSQLSKSKDSGTKRIDIK